MEIGIRIGMGIEMGMGTTTTTDVDGAWTVRTFVMLDCAENKWKYNSNRI